MYTLPALCSKFTQCIHVIRCVKLWLRDLRSFEIRCESAVPIRFDSDGPIRKFVCPLLVVVRRLKPSTALSGTVYRLASSMSDHTPVLYGVILIFYYSTIRSQCYVMRDCVTQSVTNNVCLVLVGLTHEMSYTADSIRYSRFDLYSIRMQTADSQVPTMTVLHNNRISFLN